MLVLRRRPAEAILFDGGLRMTLVALEEHRAWICCEAPSMAQRVVFTILSAHGDRARLGIRWPRTVENRDGVIAVSVGTPQGSLLDVLTEAGDDAAVLGICRQPGQRVFVANMTIALETIDTDRAILSVNVPEIKGAIGFSLISVTGAEAKIGIDAPKDMRVFREEVWKELEVANTAAAASWSDDDLAALSASRRRP